MIYAILGFYIFGIVISYGLAFAYYQRQYEIIAEECYYQDMVFSAAMSLFSWINIFALFLMIKMHGNGRKFHGLKFY